MMLQIEIFVWFAWKTLLLYNHHDLVLPPTFNTRWRCLITYEVMRSGNTRWLTGQRKPTHRLFKSCSFPSSTMFLTPDCTEYSQENNNSKVNTDWSHLVLLMIFVALLVIWSTVSKLTAGISFCVFLVCAKGHNSPLINPCHLGLNQCQFTTLIPRRSISFLFICFFFKVTQNENFERLLINPWQWFISASGKDSFQYDWAVSSISVMIVQIAFLTSSNFIQGYSKVFWLAPVIQVTEKTFDWSFPSKLQKRLLIGPCHLDYRKDFW